MEDQVQETHKCLVLLSIIVASELINNNPNHPLGIGAKFTEVKKGTEIVLEKSEAIRLEKIGAVEILDKPVIPSPEEVEQKEAQNRLDLIISQKLEAIVNPLKEKLEALTEENAKLKEDLASKKK